ncbi:MAG: polyprenol monophosphomannose synthase [Bacteroidetes bacterium]|nr:polyprenol monophosphomannose synthase [Bacteroidota bacterium]
MGKRIVVIPTYNEIENIELILDKVMSLPLDTDILVVDDNSPDGTAKAVEQKSLQYQGKIHLLSRTKKDGLGRAYVAGFTWCLENGYEQIAEMDADFSHNPDDLPELFKALDEGADVAVGSRYKTGVNVVNWDIKRVVMSYYASRYVKLITGLPINDATAGFVAYKRTVLEKINLKLIKFKGYAFQIEMKYKAWKKGFKIEEVSIIFTDRKRGKSKMSMGIFKEAFFGVIELRLKAMFGNKEFK